MPGNQRGEVGGGTGKRRHTDTEDDRAKFTASQLSVGTIEPDLQLQGFNSMNEFYDQVLPDPCFHNLANIWSRAGLVPQAGQSCRRPTQATPSPHHPNRVRSTVDSVCLFVISCLLSRYMRPVRAMAAACRCPRGQQPIFPPLKQILSPTG